MTATRPTAALQGEFLAAVLANPINRTILDRGATLGVPDWWLTAGAVFQTVWNVLDGRDPTAGIKDYDVFYFDDGDLSHAAEDAVIKTAARTFGDLPADAIDHFASTTCCFGVTNSPREGMQVHAPHGYDDLFAKRVRPNPRLAPRSVYEAKVERWLQEWPDLHVEPWPDVP